MFRKFLGAVGVIVLLLCIALLGVYLWRQARLVDPDMLLDQQTFRCYAVGESMRTIGYTRAKRKDKQVRRIARLLDKELDPLDDAKLRGELAVLSWDIANARFLRGCAEAYFMPGSTKLRPDFPEPPPAMKIEGLRRVLQDALDKVPARQRPQGLEERAVLHLSGLALARGDYEEAQKLGKAYLEKHPEGIFADAQTLILADALLADGQQEEAVALYQEIGRLPIGFEAHYARYRQSVIMRSLGDEEGADKLLHDVLKWAKRGDRAALRLVLEGQTVPPLAK